ncbi:MAG TPA: oligosaccharide flippase family protein [Caulobacteraceae bacterium]|nr:oligosaccharide flippase family protein [Caulobacteraceae bacterium]
MQPSPPQRDLNKRRGADLYFAASATAQASALLRYVVLARLLGPTELGMAATLVLTQGFFDNISDTGSDRFLIQDRDGDLPAVQRLVQLVYVGRGAAIAACLLIFAWPIALFYKTPALAQGLAILALSPLILGFLHLDVRRFQRRLDFRADAISLIIAETVALAATVTAAWLTRSFTAVLYGLILRAIVIVIVSHVRAERPYRLGLSREHARRLGRFAGPLMVNGLLLFMATQGDRALVGNQLGVATLGRYSAVILLIYYPAAMLIRYVQVMYLPALAAARDNPAERTRLVGLFGGQTMLLGLGMAAGFALVAPFLVTTLYGARFTQSAFIVALIGILQASRFLLVWPTTVALSEGRSGAALAVNTVRLIAYPAALVGGWTLGGLGGVVAGFAFGELAAQMAGLGILNRASGRPIWTDFDRVVAFVFACACILAWVWTIEHHGRLQAIGLALASAAVVGWIVRREKSTIRESLALADRLTRGLSKRLQRA